MAASIASPAQQRAHLIRQMARQSDRASSRDSNHSSAESINGMGNGYETQSQQLPAHGELDFQINTSALKRAFPHFSQYGSSSDEDSIELGRGLKKGTSGNAASMHLISADVTEDISFEVGDGVRYRVTDTPPIKSRNNKMNKYDARNEKASLATSGKENQDPHATTVDFTETESNRNTEKGGLDLHTTVESVENSISMNVKRPVSFEASTRNTRFSNSRKVTNNISNSQAARPPLVEIAQNSSAIGKTQSHAVQNETGEATPNNGTYQSFILPDIPQITELISGVRQEGTPLFSRSAIKPRSRFNTTPNHRRTKTHVPVEKVPIPADERVLYDSLKLLREKVDRLEEDKLRTEQKLEEYELEVLQLRSKMEAQDSAHISDDDRPRFATEPTFTDNLEGEKSKLELSINALQSRLERANRKVAASEVAIKNLTKDRDLAHEQLTVADVDIEELVHESEAVAKELQLVKLQLSKVTRAHERQVEKLVAQEVELRSKIERREKAINQMSALVKELWITRNALGMSTDVKSQPENVHRKPLSTRRARASSQSKTENRPVLASESDLAQNKRQNEGQNSARSNHVRCQSSGAVEDISMESDLDSTTHLQLKSARLPTAQTLQKEETFLSFMEGDEVAKLQYILDEDKAKLVDSRTNVTRGDLANPVPLPRKSSLKRTNVNNLTYSQVLQNDTEDQARLIDASVPIEYSQKMPEEITTHHSMTDIQDRTQQSVVSQRSQNRRHKKCNVPELTSAFILPDITLTSINESILGGELKAKPTQTIPRPVPASERAIDIGTEDPTIRPSQDPGLALAVVIKGLEDEVRRLRSQFSTQERLYIQHDPALSKRSRKIVYMRMQRLLAAIDLRADQIYSLYDVLEGQKAKGQLMKEEEVEITLRGVGIDPIVALRKKSVSVMINNEQQTEEAEFDDENDLPWEGIEATQTQTLPSLP